MTSLIENTKRVKAFQHNLIKCIPRSPNNRASLCAIESKTLTGLLIIYINWRLRYVACRPRKVTGLSTLDSDLRAVGLESNIKEFVKAVEAGRDLTPYLSWIYKRGYSPHRADTRHQSQHLARQRFSSQCRAPNGATLRLSPSRHPAPEPTFGTTSLSRIFSGASQCHGVAPLSSIQRSDL